MKHKNGIRERKRNHTIMITIGITLDIKEDPSNSIFDLAIPTSSYNPRQG